MSEGAPHPRVPDTLEPDPLAMVIVGEIARGRTTAQAAAACNVSTATAWRRLEALRRAWGVEHNIELVVRAVRRGLI